MRFETLFCVGLLAVCASLPAISPNARADDTSTNSNTNTTQATTQSTMDVTARLQLVDDATLRDAGIEQAQEIRQIPNKLRAQGIELSTKQEAMIQERADQLAIEASQPNFRHRVHSAMKKYGIETLKVVGYTGNLAFAVSLAPPTFVASFVEGLFRGHGLDENTSDEDAQEGAVAVVSGWALVDVLFYQAAGSVAIGVMSGSVADLIVTAIICQKHNDDADHSGIGQYCHENWALMTDVLDASKDGGGDVGAAIHHGILRLIRGIGHLFHHHSKAAPTITTPTPAPSPQAAPITP